MKNILSHNKRLILLVCCLLANTPAIAFDLGGAIGSVMKEVQRAADQSQQVSTPASAAAPTSIPQSAPSQQATAVAEQPKDGTSQPANTPVTAQPQKTVEPRNIPKLQNADSSLNPRKKRVSRWLVYDQQKCNAALAELPNVISQIRQIKIAGFSTEPVACISQELLNQCELQNDLMDYREFNWRNNHGERINCSVHNEQYPHENNLELEVYPTLNNGLIITSLEYQTQVHEGTSLEDVESPIYKSLAARYGKPIKFDERRNSLIWIDSGFNKFNVGLSRDQKNMRVMVFYLQVNLREALTTIEQQFETRKREALQREAQNQPAPKF